MHSFQAGKKRYGPNSFDNADLWLDERRYRLQSLVKKPGESFTYTYDFGDNWEHRVILERTIERSRSVVHPTCTNGENACPPEDVGGPFGYSKLKMVLANPALEKHGEMHQWSGDGVDPARFDARHQNLGLRNLRGTKLPVW